MAISECTTLLCGLDDTAQEKVIHGNYGFPVAFYDDVLEENAVPWHWHVELEILRVVSGEGLFFCDGNNLLLREGQGLFLNGGTLHGCLCTETNHCELHSIVFHPRFVSGGEDTALWTRYVMPLTQSRDFSYCRLDAQDDWARDILASLESAWQQAKREEFGFEFAVRTELSRVVLLLCQNRGSSQGDATTDKTKNLTRLKQMMEFVRSNYSEGIRAKDIADSAMISESECQRCFKNILHRTPIRYLTEVRMQKACELLVNTNFSVSKVGELCGYADNSYFGKLFRKEHTMTPAEYRLSHTKS